MLRKLLNKYGGEITGISCFLVFFGIPLILLFCYCGKLDKDPNFIREQAARYRQDRLENPSIGEIRKTVDNHKGRIVRKCFLGNNRYEMRLKDGSITYVTGKDFVN